MNQDKPNLSQLYIRSFFSRFIDSAVNIIITMTFDHICFYVTNNKMYRRNNSKLVILNKMLFWTITTINNNRI